MADILRTRLPRIMISAAGSGQGKTMLCCALLQALSERGIDVRAFKCGPDYIDPMFHRRVLSIPSYNLDSFFSDRNTLRYLLASHGCGGVAVLEGAMGYYDGLGGVSERASAYEIAKLTGTPVLLIVDASGSGLSALAVLKGFLSFHRDSQICGVIFNRLAPSLFPALKERSERELHISAVGYLPRLSEFSWESRHLGLVRPEEIPKFREQIFALAEQLEKTVDVPLILRLMEKAAELSYRPFAVPYIGSEPVIAVAMDEAFCFYYQDNLELLERMGAKLRYFSPLRDRSLPEGAGGLYLGGGYPELFAKELSRNHSMRESVRAALENRMPCIAECGGYMYLKESLEDAAGNVLPMAGVIPGHAFRVGKLTRFGYATLRANRAAMFGGGEPFPVHEFHHWDCEENGDCFLAEKPLSGRKWECIYGNDNLYAGFPHLYFYSNFPCQFLRRAAEWTDK